MKKKDYVLYKQFLKPEILEEHIVETKRVIETFYCRHYLKEHSTYFSDQSPNRESYAFTVWAGSEKSLLPALPPKIFADTVKYVTELNSKILPLLGVTDKTRLLLNVQMYKGNCKPVPVHFDGEYFSYDVLGNGQLKINHGLRPEKVAVLILANDSDGGGTRLHGPDGTSEVVVGEAGDLLVFNNQILRHSVDELTGTTKRSDGLLRMTIGWRALEENVQWIVDGEFKKDLALSEAQELHAKFIQNQWPLIFESFVKDNKLPAF